MAPGKEKRAKERLRNLIVECNIKFEGPVPQRYWPEQYRHHFGVIQKIWQSRYEEYTQRRDEDPQTIHQQIERVRDLRNKVSSLRKNLSINEDTWRDVEKLVFERYSGEVICHRCRNERWKPDYLAEPFDRADQAVLQVKQRKRKGCQCQLDIKSTTSAYEDSDDECKSMIFDIANGAEVTHDPDDRFEKRGIPMRPDRVVGLTRTTRFQEDINSFPLELNHSPISGMDKDMLYPFLVLEAKREDDAPGFRAVERQTAFPLRRFLKLQDALQKASSKNLDPLVWFFAYQGEVWRLYAGTLVDSNLRVYDLWLGTIESFDGALQLCQIVDFIWTWARDIYRHQIRKCLRSHDADYRELSPASTNPYSRSESVFSISSLRSKSHTFLETRDKSVVPSENSFHINGNIQDASSNPFLKWANSSNVSTPRIAQTSIRHANIIAFSFRLLLIPNFREHAHTLPHSLMVDENMRTRSLDLLEALQQSPYSIIMKRRHIWQLAKDWTGEDMSLYNPSSATNTDEVVSAVFFFRTIFQSHNWQIEREVCCCIMSTFTRTDVEPHPSEEFLLNQRLQNLLIALAQVRNIFGKESVSYALQNCSLILCHDNKDQLQWDSLSSQGNASVKQYLALFNSATRDSETSRLYYHHSVGLLQVFRTGEMMEIPRCFPSVSEDASKPGAMLTVRPSCWPKECPRLCLFVLPENGIDDKARLGRLLHDAIEARNFYFAESDTAHGQPPWSAADWKLLKDWEAFLGFET